MTVDGFSSRLGVSLGLGFLRHCIADGVQQNMTADKKFMIHLFQRLSRAL